MRWLLSWGRNHLNLQRALQARAGSAWPVVHTGSRCFESSRQTNLLQVEEHVHHTSDKNMAMCLHSSVNYRFVADLPRIQFQCGFFPSGVYICMLFSLVHLQCQLLLSLLSTPLSLPSALAPRAAPLFPGYHGDAERNPAPVPRLTIGINKLRFRLASSARRGLFSSGVLHFHTLGKHLSIAFEKHKRFSIMGFMFNMGNDFPSLRIAIKMFRQN